PVRDASGEAVAAISLAVPAATLTEPVRRRYAAATMDAAAQTSERLGYRP
ncbi:MAG: IclR family transcriptional regulator, partial [Candidatus Dormibacteraeota bacterium]|nr:IclR family transcriptional regulator [Candidatus Dormibacteraeota bacterium]